MTYKSPLTIFLLILISISFACFGKNQEKNQTETLPLVENKVYIDNCGTCHFVYQPGLLPYKSWEKIIDTPGGHAGGELSISSSVKNEIKKYILGNSAEKSTWEKSGKIADSITDSLPVRISEIPYIKRKHWGVRDKIFKREAIGSRGNCIACHRSAAKGVYDEDDVVIPE